MQPLLELSPGAPVSSVITNDDLIYLGSREDSFWDSSYSCGPCKEIQVARGGPLGALLLGTAAGIPFATVFVGAARARPHAPAKAVGLVNGSGSLIILAGAPLVGVTFSLPGDGRIGFAIIARSLQTGLDPAVREMKRLMREARQ